MPSALCVGVLYSQGTTIERLSLTLPFIDKKGGGGGPPLVCMRMQSGGSRADLPRRQPRARGPKLHLRESSDSSDVDSDVERLAAETIDRRRATVKTAEEGTIKAQAELEECKAAHEAKLLRLASEHQEAFEREAERTAAAEARATAADKKLAETLVSLTTAGSNLQGTELQLRESQAENEKLAKQLDASREQMRAADAKLSQLTKGKEGADAELSSREADCASLRSQLAHQTGLAESAGEQVTSLQATLKQAEAERDDLENGILRARDICAAKEEEMQRAAERSKAAIEQAVAESTRVADEQRQASVSAAVREAEAALAAHHAEAVSRAVAEAEERAEARARGEAEKLVAAAAAEKATLEQYAAELEGALLTSKELVAQRDAQMAELEQRAVAALRSAVQVASCFELWHPGAQPPAPPPPH